MGLITYQEATIRDLKNKFNSYSSEISNSLVNIYNEMNNINTILSTPKSSKTIPDIVNYYDLQIKYVKNCIDIFNLDFNTIISEYGDFMLDVKKTVGDGNDQ